MESDAKSVSDCKSIVSKNNMASDLKFIETNFTKIAETIKYLEGQNLKLTDTFEKFQTTVNSLKNIDWQYRDLLNKKIDAILNRNPDLKTIEKIARQVFTTESILENLLLSKKISTLSHYFEYSPVTSCDVERSFSRFKDILSAKRSNFTEKNLEQFLIINAYICAQLSNN